MDYVFRFFVGGAVVSFFAILGSILRPKSFAGLFGAAPSVALATISLTVIKEGPQYAAFEARSMVIGALAFAIYAYSLSNLLMRGHWSTISATTLLLLVWLGSALGLWYVIVR